MQPVTLGRRLAMTNLALVLVVLILAAASLGGLWHMRDRVLDVVDEYDEVRLIERALRHIQAAKVCAMTSPVDTATLQAELVSARRQLKAFESFQSAETEDDEEHQERESTLALEILAELDELAASAATAPRASLRKATGGILDALIELEAATDVERARKSATVTATAMIATISTLSLLLIGGAIGVSVIGFRRMMTPVRQLRAGVHRIAAGQFEHRLPPAGFLELSDLADDFNRMATELDSLYREMEDRVAEKSRELVRSERLASVGFLAAGVAHEINNPLSIISGYSELALKWLDGQPDAERLDETRSALDTIRSEAFRCKGITEQLLSLSRPDETGRHALSIGRVVGEVAALATALKGYRDRTFSLESTLSPDVAVRANEVELKQVLLNLVVNAMQATDPTEGNVRLVLDADDRRVTVAVEDNGCGIDAASLPHVFEPFWTSRNGSDERGMGLGLSISHAIVESHGGRLSAESAGPGAGSRFLLDLPRERNGDAHA